MLKFRLPITDPSVLINLIGAALCEANRSGDMCIRLADHFTLIWHTTKHRFRVLGNTTPINQGCEIIVKFHIPAVDIFEGPTSNGWWQLVAHVGYQMEQHKLYRGPWPRIRCVDQVAGRQQEHQHER